MVNRASAPHLLSESKLRCQVCKRPFDDPEEPVRSRNCGGDCLQCMSDCGDADCIAAMSKIDPDHYSAE